MDKGHVASTEFIDLSKTVYSVNQMYSSKLSERRIRQKKKWMSYIQATPASHS